MARPSDGEIFILEPIAAIVWGELVHWTSTMELSDELETNFRDIPHETREQTLRDILATLDREGLIERASA